MDRGYKVIISTHSPVMLEFAWAIKLLQNNKADFKALLALFDLKNTAPIKDMFKNILDNKSINTYYFDRGINNDVTVKDISSLDAGSEDAAVSEWGGLSSFISKASDIISKIVAANA